MAGAYRTTPTDALFMLLSLVPIDIVAANQQKKFHILRTGTNLFNNPNDLNFLDLDSLIKISTVPPQDRIVPYNDQPIATNVDIYTDGSQMEANAGLAVCVFVDKSLYESRRYQLLTVNSVFQAEATAIYLAVRWAVEHAQPCNIYSDSLSAIQAFKAYSSRSSLLHHYRQFLLQHKHLVSLNWVKAHAGVPENEFADAQAKAATQHGTPYHLPQPRSLIKATMVLNNRQDWEQYWDSPAVGSRVKKFIPRRLKDSLLIHPTFTHLLTGHGPFPAYLHRFKCRPTPLCSCGQTGDADHYLLDCPHTAEHHQDRQLYMCPDKWLMAVLEDRGLAQQVIACLQKARDICDDSAPTNSAGGSQQLNH